MHLTHKYSFKKKKNCGYNYGILIVTTCKNLHCFYKSNSGIYPQQRNKRTKNEISFTWHLQSHQENSHKNFLDEHTFSFY